MRRGRPEAARARRPTTHRVLRAVLACYVLFGLGMSITQHLLPAPPSPFTNMPDLGGESGPPRWATDPADSWSRFNSGVQKADPAWTREQFRTAVAGLTSGGRIVRMPGADTVLDQRQVLAVIKGTDVLVVVTPPTPLGAVETTRIRDNTVQKYWAEPLGLRLVMVHGQEAYLPPQDHPPDLSMLSTAASGIPLRDAMRFGDATPTVVRVARTELDSERGIKPLPSHHSPGAVSVSALTDRHARPPSAAELAPITRALDRGDLYVAPGASRTGYHRQWADLGAGHPVKVALVPFAPPGRAVDYVTPLAVRYPNAVVLVMTGKWIESAGVDRRTMLDAMMQTYGLGGFALASSAPAQPQILDWVTGIAATAISSHAFARPLPAMPDVGFPEWLGYLLLATSGVIAAGFAAESALRGRMLHRADRRPEGWRDRAVDGLTASYLQLTSEAQPALAAAAGDGAQRLLDGAFADLLELRGADVTGDPAAAQRAVRACWDALDGAAPQLGRPDAAPSTTLSKELRTAPPRAAAPATLGQRLHRAWRWAKRRRTLIGHAKWLVPVGCGVAAMVFVGHTFSSISLGSLSGKTYDISALRTSSVMTVGPRSAAAADQVQKVIGDRALIVDLEDAPAEDPMAARAYDEAEQIARAYPRSVVIVVQDGRVQASEIGRDARTGRYSVTDFIYDYYDVADTAAGDPVLLVRQFALLYDRLAAEGDVHGAVRTSFDPPSPPWVLIGIALLVALLLAGVVVRLGTRQVMTVMRHTRDLRAGRAALAIRLAPAAELLVRGPPVTGATRPADLDMERSRLLADIDASDGADWPDLQRRIDRFTDRVRATVTV